MYCMESSLIECTPKDATTKRSEGIKETSELPQEAEHICQHLQLHDLRHHKVSKQGNAPIQNKNEQN